MFLNTKNKQIFTFQDLMIQKNKIIHGYDNDLMISYILYIQRNNMLSISRIAGEENIIIIKIIFLLNEKQSQTDDTLAQIINILQIKIFNNYPNNDKNNILNDFLKSN